ncbi:pyridoxal 5'-phosphate synthase glutaminase subunit PdxT [Candidatus Woesearchaeota archaeon]|jgi:pyridoxal 5'-phosphate synthase pdxT subunit|nr:pyridoxal 5'-phosphate synthase glutaminase subunit PdxT [Candidatus Woesearchaeota archaeon]MBT5272071.1 pyridoxal 5'-phosphate synthase glutaminase subunit PdxT [Candidatus Woesearchaeota archaeon]MBT6336804.1 pyridoxal 5'-phosphate synthase glutaminase subunit PdxT [Candidatus Woesearchaeota archaeon]MBT7927661.1 pyridoxal 5'-phosphate synthase glutaminase subunit PdxT [Candidatus Woesearchaeota archaeon]
MKLGILALQGSFHEHISLLKKLDVETIQIKLPEQLNEIDGLIIPGGESTTILQLLEKYKFNLKEFNKAIFGTCAGCIVLAELGLIDVKIERNAYGCQLYSFVDDVLLENGDKVRGVFIRAPKIINLNDEIEILGKHNEDPVLVKQNNIMVATFHPELTKETKVHELFLGMIKEN